MSDTTQASAGGDDAAIELGKISHVDALKYQLGSDDPAVTIDERVIDCDFEDSSPRC